MSITWSTIEPGHWQGDRNGEEVAAIDFDKRSGYQWHTWFGGGIDRTGLSERLEQAKTEVDARWTEWETARPPKPATDTATDDAVLSIEGGVSTSGKPFLVLKRGGVALAQMTPAQGRKFGTDIIEAGNAAVNDAAVFEWLTSTGLGIEPVAAALSQLREARTKVERAMPLAMVDGSRRNASDA